MYSTKILTSTHPNYVFEVPLLRGRGEKKTKLIRATTTLIFRLRPESKRFHTRFVLSIKNNIKQHN